jgi:uncharacterized membrane protein
MKSRAHVGGHPLHPMLILIPAGGVLFTLIFDIVHLVTRDALWGYATRPILSVALIGAVAAAIPGLVDLTTIVPKGRATAIGLSHLALNTGLLALRAIDAWVRWHATEPVVGNPGFGWSILTAALLLVSGWLGWTLVQTHHVGVLEAGEGGDVPRLEGRQPVREGMGLHPDEATAGK